MHHHHHHHSGNYNNPTPFGQFDTNRDGYITQSGMF